MAKKTYAKMIEELAAEIEKKDDTRNVLNSLHTLAYNSNKYLEAKQEGNLELQKKIKSLNPTVVFKWVRLPLREQ